jgi:selenocysteine lyase/cysteine desulfurase
LNGAMLDIDFVRRQFPAFAEPALEGWVHLENAGGSYPCRQVVDRLTRFYATRKMQPYGAAAPSRLGGGEMDEARDRLAAMLNVAADELSFGPSTTANTYVLAQAFRQMMGRRGAVVVSQQDHEANAGPWRRLAEDGIEVREWRIDPATGALDPAALPSLLPGATLLAFPHASNVVAEINDVARICRMAREAGVVTCVDGVSYAPHGLPDVGGLGPDVYLLSAYKTWGPHQGLMVVRRDLADRLPNQGHFFNAAARTKRFTPAGPDHAQVAACAGIADYVDTLAEAHGIGGASAERARAVHDLIRARETALLAPLLEWAADRNDLRLIGPRSPAARAPTVALDLGRSAAPVAAALADHGIIAGGGHFYAVRPLEALGIDAEAGVLRLSLLHYTTEAETGRAIAALDAVL